MKRILKLFGYKPYKCAVCNGATKIKFKSKNELRKHVEEFHVFECLHCEINSFPFENDLKNHIKENHSSPCWVCDLTFHTKTDLEEHVKIMHPIKCLHCEHDPFETQCDLNNHMIKNHTIKCTICDVLVYTKGALERHFNLHHKCLHCNSENVEDMKKHCNLFHSKGCTECPEYKTSKPGKGKFFQNFQSVGCNFCAGDDQVFKSKKALKEHKIFFHSLKCHSCRIGAVQENLEDLKECYEEKMQNNKPQENLNNLIEKVEKIQCNMSLGPQVRNRDLPTMENQGKHDKNSSTNQKCYFCNSEDLVDIFNHQNLFHSNGCVYCPKNQDSGSIKRKNMSQTFSCNLCSNGITFKTDNELNEHRRSFHSLKCHSCRIGDAQKNIPDMQKILQLQSKF